MLYTAFVKGNQTMGLFSAMIRLSVSKGGHTQNFWNALIKKYPLILLLVAAFPAKYPLSNILLQVQIVGHF
jgi:hypothetical protein